MCKKRGDLYEKNEILRRIPKIDEVLKAGGLELLFAGAGRTVVTEAARSVIQDLRNEILKMTPEELEEFDIQRMDIEAVANRVIAYMEQEDCNNLYPVINATGTILHTNLGRAPLCKEAVENVAAVSKGYSNLEYDVEAGKRGSRHNIRKGDDESKVMYAYFDGAFHTIWNLIKENHLEVEYHEFMRARQRAEREENDKGMGAGRTGTGEGAEDVL